MLTPQGFKRKRYDDYLQELESLAKELWGADVNLSDRSSLGKFIKLLAYVRAEDSELDENVYLSAFYDTADGASLDRVAKYIGIRRIPAQKAVGTLTITVDSGKTVEAGLIGETKDGIGFVTTETVTDSDNDGIVSAKIEALEPGSRGNVPANTITVIRTPVAGVQSITNPTPTEKGRDAETDKEFRERYAISVAKGGSCTADGIRATLLNDVKGLTAAMVIENDRDVPDADGRPPHSFECIVLGGDPVDIAQTILSAKAAGIRAYGSTTVTVKDASGRDQVIGFSYATKKHIYVNVTLTKNAVFPTNGPFLVKTELIKYIGGSDADGTVYAGLGLGDDVILAKLISAVLSVPGVTDATVTVSTDNANFTSANIPIAPTEVARTSHDKLVITVV